MKEAPAPGLFSGGQERDRGAVRLHVVLGFARVHYPDTDQARRSRPFVSEFLCVDSSAIPFNFLRLVWPVRHFHSSLRLPIAAGVCRIRFPDPAAERRALGFLAGRFSFKSRADGVTLVPDYALSSLAREGIPFLVDGPASYEQLVPTLRNPPASALQ